MADGHWENSAAEIRGPANQQRWTVFEHSGGRTISTEQTDEWKHPFDVVRAEEYDALRADLQEVEHERGYWYDKAVALEQQSDEWVRLILKADDASDRERALATLANMARHRGEAE